MDSPWVPALSSHRSHSGSRMMFENIWEGKKRPSPKISVCVHVHGSYVLRSSRSACVLYPDKYTVCVEMCFVTLLCIMCIKYAAVYGCILLCLQVQRSACMCVCVCVSVS